MMTGTGGVEMRDIPGLDGRYMAAIDGRIWSVARSKFRNPSKQRTGYRTITVRCQMTKKTMTKSVHRLIAIAWIPNQECLPQVNHKDGNKQNCAVKNLEWCTGSDNMKHAWETGLQPLTEQMINSARIAQKIAVKTKRKLTEKMIFEARARVAGGEQQKSIAASFGVSQSLLSQALTGRTYQDVPPATYNAMKASKSVGKFIGASIKNVHKFTKIEKS